MSQYEESDNLDVLLRHVVRTAPMPDLPADFALQITKGACDHGEQATAEIWIVRILVMLSAIVTTAFAIVATDSTSVFIHNLLLAAPWPLLLTAAVIFGAIKLLEIKNGSIAKLPTFKSH